MITVISRAGPSAALLQCRLMRRHRATIMLCFLVLMMAYLPTAVGTDPECAADSAATADPTAVGTGATSAASLASDLASECYFAGASVASSNDTAGTDSVWHSGEKLGKAYAYYNQILHDMKSR